MQNIREAIDLKVEKRTDKVEEESWVSKEMAEPLAPAPIAIAVAEKGT